MSRFISTNTDLNSGPPESGRLRTCSFRACCHVCACRIWNGATLAAFIYMVQDNSNKSVGIAEGIFGTFCAAAGLPAGWLADRFRRDRTLRMCSFIMLGGPLPCLRPLSGLIQLSAGAARYCLHGCA